MTGDEGSDRPGTSRLPPKTLTERLSDVEVGDRIRLNERDATYEVVGSDRYSITVADADGNRLTVSQNLQTGGWTVNEAVRRVERVDAPE